MPPVCTVPWSPRYYEVDQQGVVFNAWYLAWFDEALNHFLNAAGLGEDALQKAGLDLQLVRSEIDWRSGVRWGETVEITVEPCRIGTTSFDVRFTILRAGRPTCIGKTVYVCIATDGSGKTPIAEPLLSALRTRLVPGVPPRA